MKTVATRWPSQLQLHAAACQDAFNVKRKKREIRFGVKRDVKRRHDGVQNVCICIWKFSIKFSYYLYQLYCTINLVQHTVPVNLVVKFSFFFFSCTACTLVPVRSRNPLRHGSESTFRYMYMYAVKIPYGTVPMYRGVRRTPQIYAVWDPEYVQVLCYFDKNTCPCRRGFELRTGTVRKHVYAVGDFDYVHVHVLSDPCRRGFRQRTGTDVQARKKNKRLSLWPVSVYSRVTHAFMS